ncbi:MAG: TraX family protein [Roseburia sp.]
MEKKGISGSTLKLIAIITMFIDHVGAAVLARLMLGRGVSGALYQVYAASRGIGRIAFPIFCFLLVEGFEHTRDRRQYALRLGMFALISEIPFDLAFNSRVLEFGYQNVFFTLFIGLLTIMGIRTVEEKVEWNLPLRGIFAACIAILGMGVASLFHTDYAALGVMCILALYVSRKDRWVQILAGCLAFFWWELPALIAFLPIAFYNGKRGWNIKYFFYLFYPVHLLLLYLLCHYLGIAQIPAV